MTGAVVPAALPEHLWSLASSAAEFTVIAAMPAACFLRLASHGVVAVLAADAVALPFGIRTCVAARRAPWPDIPPGTSGAVRDGMVLLPGLRVALTRWWRAPLVRRGAPPAAAALATLDEALTGCPDAPAVHAGAPPERLLGLGPGLTPYGDDVLSGRLLAAVAWGGGDGLDRRVLTAAGAATTEVSAACLTEAASGRAIPQAVALVEALSGAGGRVPGALADLLAVGHTSGHGLSVGIRHGAATALSAARSCA